MGRCLGTGQFLNRDIKKVALLDSVFLFILALDEKHSREGNGRLEENKTQGGKHMKKKIALLLAAAMTVSLMAGCGGDSGSAQTAGNSEAASAVTEEEVDPRFKYEEPVTLTSYFEISPALGEFNKEDMLNSVYYTRMTEETNISIDWLWYAANTPDDSQQKKSVAIASGEIPDFMIVNSSQLSLLAKSDLINRNIGEVFKKYASDELMAWTTGEGDAALEAATDKGEIIAIPLVDSSIDKAPMLWIRRDWIKKLGLEMPKTLDELYNVMVAFRDQDPDGNGKDDTIGMVFHNNFLSAGLGDGVGVFNGFGAYPTAWIEDGNGGLVYGSVKEENKDALNFLAKMINKMIAGSSITCRGHSLFIIVPRLFFCFIPVPFSLLASQKGSEALSQQFTLCELSRLLCPAPFHDYLPAYHSFTSSVILSSPREFSSLTKSSKLSVVSMPMITLV